ncbi:type I phosphomannose isomerase catalytic subunit [Lachnospiraceae bacterium 62-35]
MTNINMNGKVKPFLLKPVGKDYLWGGSRLNDDFSKGLALTPLAETWECSTHPDGPSIVASGGFKDRLLSSVLAEHPEFLGSHPQIGGGLPILVKLIDARHDLSVQVHPDDAYAFRKENGQQGKIEMWYVLDASEESQIIYGFYHDMEPEVLRKSLYQGDVEKYLQKVPVHKDDIFIVEPGTVHAIGAGTLIAEIQENSNLTYRMYDYNRTDSSGQRRELHIEKAMDVVNVKGSPEPRQPLRVLKYRRGCALELLCRCQYFEVYRMLLNTERCRELAEYEADSISFRVLLCINGCGSILIEGGESIIFFKGDCIFFPAASGRVRLHGKAQLLDIRG